MDTSPSSYIQVPPLRENPFTNKMAHVFTAPSDRIMFFVNDTSSVGSFINVKNGASEIEELRARDESEINVDEYILTLISRCSHLRHLQWQTTKFYPKWQAQKKMKRIVKIPMKWKTFFNRQPSTKRCRLGCSANMHLLWCWCWRWDAFQSKRIF